MTPRRLTEEELVFSRKGDGKDHNLKSIPVGAEFGHWTTLGERHGAQVTCRCTCGLVKDVDVRSLLNGVSLGCRTCRRRDRGAGVRALPEFKALKDAIRRCHNPRHRDWPNYGARGIAVCAEWCASFDAFIAHIGPRPSSKHSLDRIDNDRGYEPGNVRWATWTEQRRNQRRYLSARCIHDHATSASEGE